MITLYDGTEVDDSTPCGINPGKYPRVDSNGKKLPGNGVYKLEGLELEDKETREAAYIAEAPQRAKQVKLKQLKNYYDSDEVRLLAYGNHKVKIRDKALQGVSLVRARLVDNQEVTQAKWFYDDDTTVVVDKAEIKSLHKFIFEKDNNLREIKAEHINAIKALTDLDAIENYDITAPINGLSWI